MNNWKLRLGAALTASGFGLAGISQIDTADMKAWLITGALVGIGGQFFKILWPETDGGAQAAAQLPPNPK